MSFDLSEYATVPERIGAFFEKYPEASIQSELIWTQNGWLCKAYAYRTPGDERPGIGHAFEAVPGKTPYTKDSEAMNAETSAWGRAIVALGFETKKIASQEEVSARQSSVGEGNSDRSSAGNSPADPHGLQASRADARTATDKQKAMIRRLAKKLGLDAGNVDGLSKSDASSKIEELLAAESHADDIAEIPF